MAQQWYVTVDGDPKGPLAIGEIRLWISDGRISRETFVRLGTEGEWKAAADYDELFVLDEKVIRNASAFAAGIRPKASSPSNALALTIGVSFVVGLVIVAVAISLVWRVSVEAERAQYEKSCEDTRMEFQALAEKINVITRKQTQTLTARELRNWMTLCKMLETCGEHYRAADDRHWWQYCRDREAIDRGFRVPFPIELSDDGTPEITQTAWLDPYFLNNVDFPALLKLIELHADAYYDTDDATLPWEDSTWNQYAKEVMDDVLPLVSRWRDESRIETKSYLDETIGERIREKYRRR